jgi:hypothetical protein
MIYWVLFFLLFFVVDFVFKKDKFDSFAFICLFVICLLIATLLVLASDEYARLMNKMKRVKTA